MNVVFGPPEKPIEDVLISIASPGAGKTYTIVQECIKALERYRPEEVALTTFTRKGVQTAIDRVLLADRSLKMEDLRYFMTLHKMCFMESGLTHKNILEPRDIFAFNKLMGFQLTCSAAFDMQSTDDKLLQRYDSIRGGAKVGVYVHELQDEERYNRLVKAYEVFKKQNDLVDFYDCLIRYRDIGKPLPVECFMIDEAQDITQLQWEVIQIASRNASMIRVAGDWAQTLFSYSGADKKILIDLAEKYQTRDLDNSYRLPKKVCRLSDHIIDLMQSKRERSHIPVHNKEGMIQEIHDREVLYRIIKKDFKENGPVPGRWFLLVRTNGHIASIAKTMEQALIPYHTANGFCLQERDLNKIKRFYKYQELGYSTEEAKRNFALENGIESYDLDWTESSIIPDESRWLIADYIERYGLDKLIEMAHSPPFCLITTVHKVKGAEADNVAFFLDATKQVSSNMMVELDGELSVFYVACTRTKENLYIVQPEVKHNLSLIWEAVIESMGGKI